MYQYIKGNVEEVGDSYVVIENNGIGYYINTSRNSINYIKNNLSECKVYTYLNVRDDDMSLFGFASMEELNMFKLLLIVSKIGPKVALGVLSTITPSNIKLAILSNDVTALTKAPGIGKKTANRMILELKDKIDDNIDMDKDMLFSQDSDNLDEVSGALISLGYSRSEITNILSKIDREGLSTEAIIKNALKELAKK